MFLDGEDSPITVFQLLQKIIHLVVSVHVTAGVKGVSRLHLILHLSVNELESGHKANVEVWFETSE